jgi:hypothetical protein
MKSESFVYWLQGFLELTKAGAADGAPIMLDAKQVECLEKHLAMVFIHDIDPSMGPPEHQVKLDEAHAGAKPDKPLRPVPGSGSGWPGDGPGGAVMRC